MAKLLDHNLWRRLGYLHTSIVYVEAWANLGQQRPFFDEFPAYILSNLSKIVP